MRQRSLHILRCKGKKKYSATASAISVCLIALLLLLAAALAFGAYNFSTSSAQSFRGPPSEADSSYLSSSAVPTSYSPSPATSPATVLVYGNASYPTSNANCGNAGYAEGVIFISSGGVNYTASFTNPNQTPSGNYSVKLPNNADYKVYILFGSHCAYLNPSSHYPGTCGPGAFSLASSIISEQANLLCEPGMQSSVRVTLAYTVNAGDTLYSIGVKFGVPWQSIAQVNNIIPPYTIYPGEVLTIPSPGNTTLYTIQAGDYLYRIGTHFGVPWQTIAQLNNIQPPYTIYPGEVLVIPSSTTIETSYTVQPGDYLYSIGLNFGVPWQSIAAANGITSPYTIYPGEVLLIPSSTQCGVIYPIYGAGTALGTQTNGGLIFFTAANGFNFTSNTKATEFTLAGSFKSYANYTLYYSYGNSTNSNVQSGTLIPSLQTDGNYTLNVNLRFPVNPQERYQYFFEMMGLAHNGVTVTSSFQIQACGYAQIAFIQFIPGPR